MWTNLVQYKVIVFGLISHQGQSASHRKLMNPKARQVAFFKFTGNYSITCGKLLISGS